MRGMDVATSTKKERRNDHYSIGSLTLKKQSYAVDIHVDRNVVVVVVVVLAHACHAHTQYRVFTSLKL